MKRANRLAFILLALVVVCAVWLNLAPMEVKAAEIVSSGTCGDNLTWVLIDDGVLTISGTGTMYDYGSGAP